MWVFVLLGGSLGGGVDVLGAVRADLDNEALLQEVVNADASKGAADLEAVRDDRQGDELVLGNVVEELIESLLVEDNLVGKLVLDLSLGGPLLLLLSSL